MTLSKNENNAARQNTSRAFSKKLPSAKQHLIFWAIAIVGIALDLYTKSVVFDYVEQHGPVVVINNFLNIVSVTNDGAAFNVFAGKMIFLITVSFLALVLIIVIFLFGGSKSTLFNISMGLLAGGICGNLYDRLFNDGLVRDFIDIYVTIGGTEKHWPAFNVADSMLCIGVGLMLIASFITEQPCQKHDRPQK